MEQIEPILHDEIFQAHEEALKAITTSGEETIIDLQFAVVFFIGFLENFTMNLDPSIDAVGAIIEKLNDVVDDDLTFNNEETRSIQQVGIDAKAKLIKLFGDVKQDLKHERSIKCKTFKMPSNDQDETINQFHVDDQVKEKGLNQIMKVTSNQPGSPSFGFKHYLKTDRFVCEWTDKDGKKHSGVFDGADLESC